MLRRLEWLLPQVEGVIFEDYGKGFLTQDFVDQVGAMIAKTGKVFTADPNPGNPLRWTGVTTIKPNRAEAFAMAGMVDPGASDSPLEDSALLQAGAALLEKFGIRSVLVTLSEHGMILFDREGPPYYTPTRAKEVFDVSGAGDTAIALFTLALCAGGTLQEAAEISNHGSAVVVGKFGTATLTPDELLASYKKNPFF